MEHLNKKVGYLQKRCYKCSYGRPKQSPDLEGSILTKGSFLPEEVLVEQSAKLSFHKYFGLYAMLLQCNCIVQVECIDRQTISHAGIVEGHQTMCTMAPRVGTSVKPCSQAQARGCGMNQLLNLSS